MPPAGALSLNADGWDEPELAEEGAPAPEVVGEEVPPAAGAEVPAEELGGGAGLPKPLEVELPADPKGAALDAAGGAGGAEGPLAAGAGGGGVPPPDVAGAAIGPGAAGTSATSRPMLKAIAPTAMIRTSAAAPPPRPIKSHGGWLAAAGAGAAAG